MGVRIFQIVMEVPLGRRKGFLQWQEEGGKLSGVLDIMGHRNLVQGRLHADSSVELEGRMQTLNRTISYTAKGMVRDGRLELEMKEIRHIYKILGIEVDDA